MSELEYRVKALERRVLQLEEITTPLEFPKVPTQILNVLYFPTEEVVIAAKTILTEKLSVYLCYKAPVKSTVKTEDRELVMGNMYLDMIYQICCDGALNRQEQNIILQCYGSKIGEGMLPAHTVLEEKRERITSEMNASSVYLTFPYTLQHKLYKTASEKLKQIMSNMARARSRQNNEQRNRYRRTKKRTH